MSNHQQSHASSYTVACMKFCMICWLHNMLAQQLRPATIYTQPHTKPKLSPHNKMHCNNIESVNPHTLTWGAFAQQVRPARQLELSNNNHSHKTSSRRSSQTSQCIASSCAHYRASALTWGALAQQVSPARQLNLSKVRGGTLQVRQTACRARNREKGKEKEST